MRKKRIIVSVTNDLYTDQRVRKVCEFLVESNYEVILCGRLLANSAPMPKTSYKTVRFKLPFTKGPLFYATYNLRLFFYLLFHRFDDLLANDLDTLLANAMVKTLKPKGRLFYDSHEFYTGVPELVNRPKVQKIWTKIEQWALPKTDKMYTVNESIADLYRALYPGKEIGVVRNISDLKHFTPTKNRHELGLATDKRIIIIQGAGINVDRGAEEMVEAMTFLENCLLIFVGDGDVIPRLKEKVKQDQLEDRVLFFGKQPYVDLMNYTAASDLGISMDKDSNINYRFSLPNKIFDYIHAGIPVLVSDLVEVKRVVETYQIGWVTQSHHPKDIARLIQSIFNDPTQYKTFKDNTQKAAQQLTWENEKKVLKRMYEIQ